MIEKIFQIENNDAVKQSVADDLNKVLANDLAVQQVKDGGVDTPPTVRALNRQGSEVFESFTKMSPDLLLRSLTRNTHSTLVSRNPGRGA